MVESHLNQNNAGKSQVHRPSWLVAVIANVKGETVLPKGGPPDAGAEFDSRETIQSIQEAIESRGHRTIFLPGDRNLPHRLDERQPDICFNIAEGLIGDGREAHIPALLELFEIPYTASRVVANAISLDKALTKRLWREAGLPVAPFQEVFSASTPLNSDMDFPLFVKPAREGTGMGIDLGAVIHNEQDLYQRIQWVLDTYHGPALVEKFLPGREFTVGLLGRPDFLPFSERLHLYDETGYHKFPVLEIESRRSITPGVYGYKAKSKDLTEKGAPGYLCPAPIDQDFADHLYKLALQAHLAIGALDVCRVDFRMDENGNPLLLEINTLPGLNPAVSDLCIMAHAEEFPYAELILEILDLAASRFGLL